MSRPGWLHVVKSVVAAGIGVQSEKNRKIDFQQGVWYQYAIVGVVATALFIFALVMVVSLVV